MTDRFRIGVFSSVHGIRGEAKIFITSDEPERFRKLKEVFVSRPAGSVSAGNADGKVLKPVSVRFFKNMAIMKFQGIDTPEEVRKYMGWELWVDRKDAIPLEEGEYYIADLIGLSVVTEDGTELGKVKEIWPTGANYVITVKRKKGEDVLLPYIPDCVKEVSLEEGVIRIHLMEGLI